MKLDYKQLTEDDLLWVHEYLSDYDVVRFLPNKMHNQTYKQVVEWFYRDNSATRIVDLKFAIFLDRFPVGTTSLGVSPDLVGGGGMWLIKDLWGFGIGTKTLKWKLQFLFDSYSCVGAYATSYVIGNKASQKMQEKCGFVLNEGKKRDGLVDMIITREMWEKG